ncbi:MBG-2 domain-containing protein, partial [Aquitalea aquatica]
TLSFGTSANSTSNVGSYAINGSGLTSNGNYVFAQAAGNSSALSITPASLSVTASNASKTYNGLGYTGGNGVSYSGFVNGESSSVLGGSLSYGGTAQNAINAGSYSLLAQGLTSSNYAISYTAGSLTVNPATLTYTANSASRTYGASNPSFSGSITGLVNNETLTNVTSGTLSFGTTATSGSNVGSYAINGSGLTSNGNYVFAQAAGNSSALSITAAAPRPAPALTPADTEKYLPQTTTIPKFPDNAQQVLSNTAGTASFGGLNYVAVPELAANSAPASSTAPTTTAGIASQPAADTASSPGQSSVSSSGNQPAPTGGSSLNYVASKDGPLSASTGDGKKSANELNVNDVTVPSSTGPLDVHVVNGGINMATLFGGGQ